MKSNHTYHKINEIIEPAELVQRFLNEFKGNKHTPTGSKKPNNFSIFVLKLKDDSGN